MTRAFNQAVPELAQSRKRSDRARLRLALAIMIIISSLIVWLPSSRIEVEAELSTGDESLASIENYCALTQARDIGKEEYAIAFGEDLPPVRCLMDPYPSFNSVALDSKNNLVVMSDSNRKSLLVYDRRAGSKSRETTVPLQQITGPKTQVGFVAGVALDPDSREIFAVNNDIEDTMMVFSYDDEGNINPKRILAVPHQSWGLAIGRSADEIALTVQSLDAVVFYRRTADKVEPPTRSILGLHTRLADPHGIILDEKNKEILVTNHGNWGEGDVSIGETGETSGGRFEPPSVSVFDYEASGDARPRRRIAGDRTQLDWPMGASIDALNNELLVANNGQNSIIVFDRAGDGNVAPKRVLRGPKTGISLPMNVVIDNAHNEIWVANFGDHNALVFDAKASGNVAPKRIVRNAPAGSPTVGFGNPMAAAYDSKRHEILVPN